MNEAAATAETASPGSVRAAEPAAEVSLFRLYLLRTLYAFIVVGLALFVWPNYLARVPDLPLFNGVALTMLAAFSILCALGIRYPLQMLPVLLWELLWKAMWLLLVALPLWTSGRMDERTFQTAVDCLIGVVLVPLAMPWGYVYSEYVRKPGARWR
ncbi:MAG: hypothetical protein M3N07_02400 [Pseudomonadota bacterium]|nr:hypothetical protein [Pseudomonadota bacterium]